jgi:type I restriction enzyme R subunit
MISRDTSKNAARSFEQGCLTLLQQLGWNELPPGGIDARGIGGRHNVVLQSILEAQLRAINSFEYQGRQHKFSTTAIEAACAALLGSGGGDVRYSNEKVWTLLRFGTPVLENIEGYSKSFTLQFIDWDRPENNSYHVVREFSIQTDTTVHRPDFVLFVNGIPFVVIECKQTSSSTRNGEQALDQAITRLLTYQHERNIPKLFHFAQLLLAITEDDAEYATVGTPRRSWTRWREREGSESTIQETLAHLESTAAQPRSPDSVVESLLDEGTRLLYALCRPRRLLELIRWFTFFTPHGRALARYYQYFAVQDVLRRVSTLAPDGQRRGGLIQHTQGSGKSMTQVMLSRALLDVFKKQKPRVVLVTDRTDTGDLIYNTLTAGGVECRQANTGSELLKLLRDSQTRVITSLIHKFDSAFRSRPMGLDDPNIFVLVDEAQRTQSGQLHHAMRRTLPRACFLGFTGVSHLNPKVRDTFGEVISTYKGEQAVADQVLVPTYIEVGGTRGLDRDLRYDRIMEEFAAEGLTRSQEQALADRFSELESEERIKALANTIAEDFKERVAPLRLKGQLVATSRRAALRFKSYLDDLDVSSEVAISLQDTPLDRDDELIQRFRHKVRSQFGSEARYESDTVDRFINSDDPRILIVVSKFLAGFDAPRTAVLYLTRPLSHHVLEQAIARVNRPSEGKEAGFVVDYVGATRYLDLLTGEEDEVQVPTGSDLAGTGPAESEARREDTEQRDSEGAYEHGLVVLEGSCYELIVQQLAEGGVTVASDPIRKLAARIAQEIIARRKVEWTQNIDTQNRMKTAIEDRLFGFQAEQKVSLPLTSIDIILDRCVEEAVLIFAEP